MNLRVGLKDYDVNEKVAKAIDGDGIKYYDGDRMIMSLGSRGGEKVFFEPREGGNKIAHSAR
jgi:hypothetical protein